MQPILTGRPLPEEPSSEALQALLARAPGAHALALEAAARQKKVPESWVVLVGSPQSEELRGMWPLNGPPSAPRAAQAAVQWEQKEVGRNRLTVVAGSLNYFAECDKSKSDEASNCALLQLANTKSAFSAYVLLSLGGRRGAGGRGGRRF